MPGIVCTGGADETGGDAGDGDAAGGAPVAGVWALTRRWGGHQSATLHTATATTRRPPMMAHWMRAGLDLPGRVMGARRPAQRRRAARPHVGWVRRAARR